MLEKQVPLLPSPTRSVLVVGSRDDNRLQSRLALFMNDLHSALEWLRFELEHITIHSQRRDELRLFIDAIDNQVRVKPAHFIEETLDVYLDILEMARHNPRCNGYRTRYGQTAQRDIDATMRFAYLAGECRGKLMMLYDSGERVLDEDLEDIIDSLPMWDA